MILFPFLLSNCGSKGETNILQVKFEEQRATLYSEYISAKNEIKKSTVFNKSRKNTCDFVNKHGSSFINWYGEITYLSTDQGGDEVDLSITSSENGITVKYEIYGIRMNSDLYNQISNFAEGDYVYFNFNPQGILAINSTEKECFDENSFTEEGSLRAPEFFANITRIGSEPDDITQEEIAKLEEELVEKAKMERLKRGEFNNKDEFAEWVKYLETFTGGKGVKLTYDFTGKGNSFSLTAVFEEEALRAHYATIGDVDEAQTYYGTYTVKSAEYRKDGEVYHYLDLSYDNTDWTSRNQYLVYRNKRLVKPTKSGHNSVYTDKNGFEKRYIQMAFARHEFKPTKKWDSIKKIKSEKKVKMCEYCPNIPTEDGSSMCSDCISEEDEMDGMGPDINDLGGDEEEVDLDNDAKTYSEEENEFPKKNKLLHGNVNVENLNFRSTPQIEDNNIIGKLFSGQKILILNTIQSDTDSKKGLLRKETIVEYKGGKIKFQPNKAIEVINTLSKIDNSGRTVSQSFECTAMINENESIIFNIDASSVELISTEDWVQIRTEDGTIGYVYSRFITKLF